MSYHTARRARRIPMSRIIGGVYWSIAARVRWHVYAISGR